MIDAITSDHIDELQGYIDQLSEFHKRLRLRMGKRKSKSKKWAVWLLQGGSLSLSRSMLNAARDSQREVVESNTRYAHELVTLIAYFNRKTTSASMARKWFDGALWVPPVNTNKMNKRDKEIEERNQELYQLAHGCHSVGNPELNHRMSEMLHPSYSRVNYSFMYNASKRDIDFYSLIGNKEYFPKIDNYRLRLLIEDSAFALCNGDNVMNYSKEDYSILKGIHDAMHDGRKYMKYAKLMG